MSENGKNALLIFVKNPLKGKVKSRLAEGIGEEKALEVYELLLQHTCNICREVEADKFVFYADFIPEKDIWNGSVYYKYMQEGSDLGERMKRAFKVIFNFGYKNVVIIGSDCYELRFDEIKMAFNLLQNTKVVIGPAKDGGYYLLGLNQEFPDLFEGIPWSTSNVLEKTVEKLDQLKTSFTMLSVLNDIDTESDLPVDIQNKIGLRKTQESF